MRELFDSYDEDDEREEGEIRCKYCFMTGLHWEEGRGERNQKQWLLVDEDGEIHDCPKKGSAQRVASPDDFEDLDA